MRIKTSRMHHYTPEAQFFVREKRTCAAAEVPSVHRLQWLALLLLEGGCLRRRRPLDLVSTRPIVKVGKLKLGVADKPDPVLPVPAGRTKNST